MESRKLKMKDEIGKYYDIEPQLDLKNFVELLFACLANKKILEGRMRKPIYFPFDYLRIIEMIMNNEDSTWKIKFSKLIDIKKYYEKQSEWELMLGREINKYLSEKRVVYDFGYNYFSVGIREEETDEILKKYDEETIEIMEHFTNLLSDVSYERRALLIQKESNRWQQEKMREMENLDYIVALERKMTKEQNKK